MVDISLGYDFKEWSEIIRNCGLLIPAFATPFIAWRGLTIWRDQKIWEEDRALAKLLLLKVYEVREAIRDFRSPFMSAGEMANAVDGGSVNFLDNQERKIATQKAYIIRLSNITNLFKEIYPVEIECKVMWGEEIPDLLKRLRMLVMDLQFAIEESPIFSPFGELTGDDLKKNRSIIYRASGSKNDEFATRVESVLVDLNLIVSPYLGRRP